MSPEGWAGLALAPRCSRATRAAGPGANRSSRWRGSEAVTAHDLAKPFDVRRAVAAEHVGYIFEVARAHQTRADDREEAGVSVALIAESVDHAARYEQRLVRVQVGSRPAHGERSDAVQTENGFVELVVAVRRGHARISGGIALEDADTATRLICVDVKSDRESPDLDRLGCGVGHEVIIPAFGALSRQRQCRREEPPWRHARARSPLPTGRHQTIRRYSARLRERPRAS